MANAWSPFYWRDYIADTGHLSLAEHGAYILLMAHYYSTGKPIPADPEQLGRICRCSKHDDNQTVIQILTHFFVRDGEVYRHRRIDDEIAKQQRVSAEYAARAKAGAAARWKRADATSNASSIPQAMLADAKPQPQPQEPESKARACAYTPTLNEVQAYCEERKNHVDSQKWFDHYSSNGWRVGRNRMKDWRAAVRTWERNGIDAAPAKRRPSEGISGDWPPEPDAAVCRTCGGQKLLHQAAHVPGPRLIPCPDCSPAASKPPIAADNPSLRTLAQVNSASP
jgi:uncharacterized protein YdaU (DUF1376 family)